MMENGAKIAMSNYYVNPPGKEVSLLNQTLQFAKPAEGKAPFFPIDTFFRSLAESEKERVVRDSLGTAKDGTLGLMAVKSNRPNGFFFLLRQGWSCSMRAYTKQPEPVHRYRCEEGRFTVMLWAVTMCSNAGLEEARMSLLRESEGSTNIARSKPIRRISAAAQDSTPVRRGSKNGREFDPHAFLATIGQGRKAMLFQRNQPIFVQGDPANTLFYLQTGKVKLTVVSKIIYYN